MHKVLLPVVDYSMDFDLLQFTYDRRLFKTVMGAINSSKASGCSPNCGLQQKSFSATFWRWQHLLLVDAVRQYGFPSFVVTISPYEWTFPWPGFIQNIRDEHCLEPTDLPVLETLHVAHVLEQIARGYLAGANTNRWRHHVFGNSHKPMDRNVITYFYRFEFQSRGTLHLHMLVWVKDLALIRANLLRASIPWGNAEDAFLVADTQKSSSSCLPIFDAPDCLEQWEDGSSTIRFHYSQEDSNRNPLQSRGQREPNNESMSLLEWLRCHTVVGRKAKSLGADKFLVAVKFLSVHNPVFFFQHLLVHHPHRSPSQLRHLEEATMPPAIKHFSQALQLCPERWTTSSQILAQFELEGHRSSYLTTLVAFVMALHDIHFLWQRRVVDSRIGSLHGASLERLYPLSPYQTAIYRDIVDSLAKRQRFLQQGGARVPSDSSPSSSGDSSWTKYRVLLGKPGTGKSQVIIRAMHTAIQQEQKVLLAAPVALLAQGYREIFGEDLHCETLHAAFNIPVNTCHKADVNFALNRFDMLVVDEGSLVSPESFQVVAATLNRLNCRPVVVIAGDKKQQQPLKTVQGKTSTTRSILNDHAFVADNSVRHSLYEQFRVLDKDYAAFLDIIRHLQPSQQQLEDFQQNLVLCPSGVLADEDIFQAYSKTPDTIIMTVSRAAAQRVNGVVTHKLFAGQTPLCQLPCASVADGAPILPYRGMKIVITENRDKSSRVVNGQEATLVSNQNNTLLIQYRDGQRAFLYPVTHFQEGKGDVTCFPMTPAYARTISKSQGQNIKHLLVWLDCNTVPAGLAYVALSRVRRRGDVSLMQPVYSHQFQPVED